MSREKILTEPDAIAWVERERSRGNKIGFTCGAFDILHAGHVDYLAKARELCERLIVAVNTDESIRSYKHPFRPINPQHLRLRVVAALECVDAAMLMPDTRPLRLLQLLRPDLYIKGGDYAPSKLRSGPFVQSYGGRVVVIPVAVEISTSAILERAALIGLHEAGPDPERRDRERIAFLDRDGTLIRDVPFLADPKLVELLPGVVEGLLSLQRAGFRLVIVTNQQGIGLGYLSRQDFIAVNQELLRQLGAHGIRISRIYYCPHSIADECVCRKPSPYLFERGMKEYHARPEDCYVIGDSDADIEGAKRAGCQAIRLGAGGMAGFGEAVREILSRAAQA